MTPTAEQPFALWTIFRGIHRWFLAPGCPPTLMDERRWVRGLRTSVLLGMLGLLSSWMTTLWLYLGREFNNSDIANDTWIIAQGLIFGLCVMLPLSRWIGRGRLHSGFGLLISVVLYFAAALMWRQNPLNAVASAAATLGFSFVELRRPRTWFLVPLTAIAGLVGLELCGVFGGSVRGVWPPTLLSRLEDLLQINAIFAPFHTLIAIALGFRLWWDTPQYAAQPSPRPAANTAATSTAKPGQQHR
ncbi:MAG: hypothetical protein SH850_18225 [Planctomycetaceae bacterium]|nr:hypothetical protein [Planctomycetaceae bacterium]